MINKKKKKSHDYRIFNRIKVWEYLSTHPCRDCGETDPVVLEFDHVRGKKKERVSLLVNANSWETVKKEIDKCEVRCGNCHKKKTAKTHKYYHVVKQLFETFKR